MKIKTGKSIIRKIFGALLLVILIVPLLWVGGVVLSALLFGNGDYEAQLPNGYMLYRMNDSEIFIWGPDKRFAPRIEVPPSVAKIGGRGDIVYGYTESNSFLANHSGWGDKIVEGFFVLDTKTDTVSVGLTKDEWLKALAVHKITKEPSLKKPSRWFSVSK